MPALEGKREFYASECIAVFWDFFKKKCNVSLPKSGIVRIMQSIAQKGRDFAADQPDSFCQWQDKTTITDGNSHKRSPLNIA
jgi:hypothetical protein